MRLTTLQILTLGGPAVSVLFSLGFILVWRYGRRRAHYLLFLSAAFFVYAVTSSSQILLIPRDLGINALFTGGLFMAALLLLIYGLAGRYRAQFDGILYGLVFIVVMAALAYFYYENPNLVARIYFLNFGVGGMVLLSVFRIRRASRGAVVDRALFWSYLLFGVSFFPRTILSVGASFSSRTEPFSSTPFWMALQLSLLLFAVVLAMLLLAAALLDIIDILQRDRNIDGLTKLFNRRSFEEQSQRELAAGRSEPISLVICDLDRFKAINDNYGHYAGDMALVKFASVIRRCIRKHDIAGRFGGEEFIVLLPNTTLEAAACFAERLRLKLSNTPFPGLDEVQPVTSSFGVVELLPGETLASMIRRADHLLYTAKSAGRNRVMVAGKPAGSVSYHNQENGVASQVS